MKLEPVLCPQCSAPIDVYPELGFCECNHCHVLLTIRGDSESLQLNTFDDALKTLNKNIDYSTARVRIEDLEDLIGKALSEYETKARNLKNAKDAFSEIGKVCKKDESATGVWFVLFFLFTLVTCCLSVFALKNGAPYSGIVVINIASIGLTVLFLFVWQNTLEKTPGKLQEAQKQIDQAVQEEVEALAILNSFYFEQELCQRTVDNFKFTGGLD